MSASIKIPILGDATSFAKACHKAQSEADGLSGKLKSVVTSGPFAFAALGTAAAGFAMKSANTFSKIGKEVAKIERLTGATAEAASRLRFAAKMSGQDIDKFGKSLGLFSKNLVAGKVDDFGVATKDAFGKMRPLNDVLLDVAAKFKSMPNGAEKTAMALKLFGRAGADLLPFLNKGADGLRELEEMSDKYGNTLTEKDIEAVKESTKQNRLFSAAMDGLQIAVGRYVLPVITNFVGYLSEHMPQIIKIVNDKLHELGAWFREHGPAAIATAKGAFETLGRFFTETVPMWGEKISELWENFNAGLDKLKPFATSLAAFFKTELDGIIKIINGLIRVYNAIPLLGNIPTLENPFGGSSGSSGPYDPPGGSTIPGMPGGPALQPGMPGYDPPGGSTIPGLPGGPALQPGIAGYDPAGGSSIKGMPGGPSMTLNIYGEPDPVLVAKMQAAAAAIAMRERINAGWGVL